MWSGVRRQLGRQFIEQAVPAAEGERMKKMVRTLKGIVPAGGDRMDTPVVKYLKSLQVEAKQLGMKHHRSWVSVMLQGLTVQRMHYGTAPRTARCRICTRLALLILLQVLPIAALRRWK